MLLLILNSWDFVVEKDVISALNTPAKRSRSESSLYVLEVDDDLSAQLSRSKVVNRVIKERKMHKSQIIDET